MSTVAEIFTCNVCGHALGAPVYTSNTGMSVTSLCELEVIDTRVFFCHQCGHVQTPQLADVHDYYSNDYKILVDSEEEDQLYKVVDGRMIYRSEHQAGTLIDVVDIPTNARVLDYGCAKAATIRRLKEQRPDVDVHLFDVSDMYLPFWEKLTTLNKWATFTPQAQWLTGYFDLITSFYSLEHMPKPAESVDTIAKMLAPDGRFYVVVPDWQTNIADYVVVDHVNHFSPQSLAQLMVRAGLHVEMVKAELHDSALVMVARKPALDQPVAQLVPENLGALEQRAVEVANYWSSFQERVQAFEQCARDAGLAPAIYGSGFYGTYIASCLKNLPAVSCFLDQNPFRQGKTLMGKPIVAPADLPPSVGALYVGLNPARAKTEIEKTQALSQRQLTLFLP
jgi:SAM-dependent methyltransferase